MSIPNGEEMREMLRFGTRFNLERANKNGTTSTRMTKLVARKLCPHHNLEAIGLVQNRLRIRCTDCGATAVHREKR